MVALELAPNGRPGPCPTGTRRPRLAVDANGTGWVLAADITGSFFSITNGVIAPVPGGLPGAASFGAASLGSGRRSAAVWATAAADGADYSPLHLSEQWLARPRRAPPISNLDWNNYPQGLQVGRDGGVWLLDGSGNAWSPGTMSWSAEGKSVLFQSLAAANVGNSAIAAADNDAAWGVTAAGAISAASFGNGWALDYAALPNGTAGAAVSVGGDG